MRFDMHIEGLQELQDQLKELAEAVDTLHGQTPSFQDLLDPAFMLTHTQYASFEELIGRGFGLSSVEAFLDLANEERDRLVAEHTAFPSWDEMLAQAGVEWAARWTGLAQE